VIQTIAGHQNRKSKIVIRKSEKVRHPGMLPLNILADIQHNAGKEVEYQRETHR